MQRTIKLRVFGMTCDSCVNKVSDGLKEKEGVIDVKVSLDTGIATVVIDQDRVKPEELEILPIFTGKSHYRAQVRENEG
jgi:copper chaperone CopZ